MATKFTESYVAGLPYSDKPAFYFASNAPGLQLVVGKTKKTFRHVYRFEGKECSKRLGHWPALPVREAIARVSAAVTALSRGDDPYYVAPPRDAFTLRDALEQTIKSRMDRGKMRESTAKQYRDAVHLHCKSWLDRDLRDIERKDIVALHSKLSHSPAAANQLLRVISSIYNRCEVEPNPARNFDAYKLQPRRVAIPDLPTWFNEAMADQNKTRANLLKFILFTGLRKDNARLLRWADYDAERQTIHLAQTKTTDNIVLPICDMARDAIEAQRGRDDERVFPITDLRIEGEGRVHDLRRVFTNAAARAKLPGYVIDQLRGDRPKTVRDHYMVDDEVLATHEDVAKIQSEILKRVSTGNGSRPYIVSGVSNE